VASSARVTREPPEVDGNAGTEVPASRTGYVQFVDPEALLELARKQSGTVRMGVGVGDFVVAGRPIATITRDHGAELGEDGLRDVARAIRSAVQVGPHRTVEQDPAYGVQQLVDIALRALSPGINDPTTAITCMHYIGAVLALVVERADESGWRQEGGVLRVVTRAPSFSQLLDLGFDELRRYGEARVTVLLRLAETLALLGDATQRADQREAILRHLERLGEAAERSIVSATDRATILSAVAGARARLGAGHIVP
jgi:uncharacterized membrane protein